LQGIQPLFMPFCFTILSYVVRGSYGCFGGSVGLQIRALCGLKRASSLYHCEVIICVGVEPKSEKRQNEMGGTSRVATCHDKDVLYVEVKRDIPQDMGLHFVARRASIDKHRPYYSLMMSEAWLYVRTYSYVNMLLYLVCTKDARLITYFDCSIGRLDC
jgi:hypothetical protein